MLMINEKNVMTKANKTSLLFDQINRALDERRCRSVQVMMHIAHTDDPNVGIIVARIISIPSDCMKNRIKQIMETNFCETADLVAETKTTMEYSVGIITRGGVC